MAPTSPRLLADALSAYAVTMLEKALPCSFSCASEAKGALAEAGKSGGFDDAHEQTPERTHVVGSPLDAVKTWLQDEQVPQSIKEAFVEQLEQTQQSDEILRLVTDFCGYHAPLHPSHEDPRPKAARQLESVSPQASLSEKKKAEMAMEKTIPAAFGCAICCGTSVRPLRRHLPWYYQVGLIYGLFVDSCRRTDASTCESRVRPQLLPLLPEPLAQELHQLPHVPPPNAALGHSAEQAGGCEPGPAGDDDYAVP